MSIKNLLLKSLTLTYFIFQGGPLHLKSQSKNNLFYYRLIGVTSFGQYCASGAPGHTRIFAYLDWIESIVWPS